MNLRFKAIALALSGAAILAAALAGPAAASPGALRMLIVESQYEPTVQATRLRSELLAQQGVAAVDFFDGAQATPSVDQLSQYDVVVVMSYNPWKSQEAMGDNLADYQDRQGVVVAAEYVWEGGGEYNLLGRWVTGGYTPFEIGAGGGFTDATLGAVDAASPILSGVSTLSSHFRVEVVLTPGATEIAAWSDGLPAIAVKGRAVGINAYLGEEEAAEHPYGGDFARVIVNAGNVLGRQRLTVAKAGNAAGTVTSNPSGIDCGAICSAVFDNGAAVTLSAAPSGPATFVGWSGAGCSGTGSCTVTANASPTVTATFEACVVPKLKGRTLKRARKALRAAHCKLGKVKPKAPRRGRVRRQRPKPGAVRPLNSAVKVTLEPAGRHSSK